MMNHIKEKQAELTRHPVYETFNSLESIRHFMGYHVFAVWDFMSLLKALQIRLTCVSLPWRPSGYPAEMVRLINQIVLGEESDLDKNGHPVSHFDLYLRGMEEIGADTTLIRKFLETNDFSLIPHGAKEFVLHNLEVAEKGHIVEVASNFFFGREKLIPDMFQSIVDTLKREGVAAPTFIYYLERHIEVDSGEHGPLALKALSHLTKNDPELMMMAHSAGLKALEMRWSLWDKVLETLSEGRTKTQIQESSYLL
jgi:Protein of unknown function (DUF3050)